ncbi:transcriptional repressor [bacterium]|nr:transcriptional repressor [bacterium]
MNEKPKYRFSRQRKVILDELKKARCHPTADVLYRTIRKQLPKISLGTVYRNLDLLIQQGLVLKILIDGHPSRFEYVDKDHIHIRCVSCGKIDDLPFEPSLSLDDVKIKSEYEIVGYNQEFIGKCPDCLRKEKQQKQVKV